MTKVIKIEDVDNYASNLEEMVNNDTNIEILKDAKDFTKCEMKINMVFRTHDKYCHLEEKEIEINHVILHSLVCNYLINRFKERNEELQKRNRNLEVEVDIDGK